MGALRTRALPFGDDIQAHDFGKLPFRICSDIAALFGWRFHALKARPPTRPLNVFNDRSGVALHT